MKNITIFILATLTILSTASHAKDQAEYGMLLNLKMGSIVKISNDTYDEFRELNDSLDFNEDDLLIVVGVSKAHYPWVADIKYNVIKVERACDTCPYIQGDFAKYIIVGRFDYFNSSVKRGYFGKAYVEVFEEKISIKFNEKNK